MTPGSRIAVLRKGRSLTQVQLAKEIGMSSSTVAMWETDSRDPSIKALEAMARLFDVSTDYLLGLEAPPHQPKHPNAVKLKLYAVYEPASMSVTVLENDYRTVETLGVLEAIKQMVAANLRTEGDEHE